MGKITRFFKTLRRKKGKSEESSIELIGEEPLVIRVDDKPYSVVMRTPGEEICQAAGFCLGEGIVSSPHDLKTIGFDEHLDPNAVDVWLKEERHQKILDRLDRRFFVSQTSCGICGKELIKDLEQILVPTQSDFTIDLESVFFCLNKLTESQNYYQTTRGSHAALLFDENLKEISFAEDVGRHNALDKAIGKAFLDGKLPSAQIGILSSRISYELVQKAARAHLALMLSHSRPTSLAVEMSESLNITLAFPDSESELVVLCGHDRIKKD